MNQPAHSIQHARKKFKIVQFIAAVFAFLTIMTALAAVLSGYQITRLHKRQIASLPPAAPVADPAAETVLKGEMSKLQTQLTESQQQLTAEKKRVRNLSAKITDLETQLKKALETPTSADASAPEKAPLVENSAPAADTAPSD